MDILIFLMRLIAIIVMPFVILYAAYFIYYRYCKRIKRKKGISRPLKKESILKRIFYEMPRQIVLDYLKDDPDRFKEMGVHLVCGEQGSGKSVTVTYLLQRFKKQYPKIVIKTNYGYAEQDAEIKHWQEIIDSQNGIYGEIDVLDEIQNWFNSMQSKNFPPEMMQEITQQRKQRKMILGTSQVFNRVAKPIREQINYIYKPITLFGCLTIVRKYKPSVGSSDGEIDDLKLRGMFFFVQNEEVRNAFDTYHKIKMLVKDGFKDETKQIRKYNNKTEY